MSNTPDFMPRLSAGAHDHPSDGACVMEYVSFITGDVFTDMPDCTPHELARLAQYANDSMSDDESRTKYLTPLIPRLLGAGQSDEYDARMAQFMGGLARTEDTHGQMDGWTPEQHRDAFSNIYSAFGHLMGFRSRSVRFDDETPEQFRARRDANIATILTDVLDDYDLFLKRDKPADLTPEQVDAVERLTSLITV